METKLFLEADFPNLLDELSMSYEEAIEMIDSIDYVKPDKYVGTMEEFEIENKTNLPFFNKTFYSFIKNNYRIPTQNEFYQKYLSDNKEFVEKFDGKEKYLEAIEKRAMRSYTSLIRDLTFALFLKERKGLKTIFNEDLDRNGNIDVMIVGKRGNWGLHLFTKTKRAEKFRKKKNNRHDYTFSNVTDIDLEIDLSKDGEKHGNIYLYGEKCYENLLEIVKKHS